MNTQDSELSKIARDIERSNDKKRGTQREIDYYTAEIEKLNRELQYHRSQMSQHDADQMRLLGEEKRRREQLEREERAKR